ncbi:MAG: hypothetical protein OEW37_06170 [Rhodospirillaceae bacterium]|nr:hypothetical protein [Rhodospirillaceae bacterium]
MNAGHQSVTDIEEINAPWNKLLTVQEAIYEGGFKMVRLRIKEGKRFTDLELDSATAANLAELLQKWAKDNPPT